MSARMAAFLTLLALTAGHVQFDTTAPLVSQAINETTVLANGAIQTVTWEPVAETECTLDRDGKCAGMLTVRTRGLRVEDGLSDPDALAMLTHELAHVWDLMDDGYANGSPGKAQRFPPGGHCDSNEAERYACTVALTGRIQP